MEISNTHLLVAYENFVERLKEVEEYLSFVQKVSNMQSPVVVDNPIMAYGETELNRQQAYNSDLSKKYQLENELGINRDLQKTLRASTYLLLYNLMESTMSETIHAVHETIHDEQLQLTELSEKLHKIILKSFQKSFTNEKVGEFSKENKDITESIFNLGYNKKKLFSGNIDSEVIEEYCKKYGFRAYPYTKDGETLRWKKDLIRNIKQKRNSLAHGSESFVQCGQNIAIDTILHNLQSVYAVLMAVFNGLNYFLDNKHYLRNSS